MKKMFFGVTCALMLAGLSQAQTTDVKKNAHQNYDQRARDCKKQAADQNGQKRQNQQHRVDVRRLLQQERPTAAIRLI